MVHSNIHMYIKFFHVKFVPSPLSIYVSHIQIISKLSFTFHFHLNDFHLNESFYYEAHYQTLKCIIIMKNKLAKIATLKTILSIYMAT